jgi:hypothetical protein
MYGTRRSDFTQGVVNEAVCSNLTARGPFPDGAFGWCAGREVCDRCGWSSRTIAPARPKALTSAAVAPDIVGTSKSDRGFAAHHLFH